MTNRVLPAILLASLMISSGQGQVVINEVMANEPGAYRSLEWIELASASAVTVDLSDFVLYTNDDTVQFPAGKRIEPGDFIVLCRRLTSNDGSASFEGYWGDSSGIWGDCDIENTLGMPLEANFGLTNSGGSVLLYDGSREVSYLEWNSSGSDGVSWERYEPGSDSIALSRDVTGSTPGRINSMTPVQNDLAIENVACSVDDFITSIGITVRNSGRTTSAAVEMLFTSPTVTAAIDLAPMESDEDTLIELSLRLSDLWTPLGLRLPEDDRPANNSASFYAPGGDYPPLIITEFMANPQIGLASEWVELLNRSEQVWELEAWQIGDSRQSYPLTGAGSLQPGERIVLAQDGAAMLAFYSSVEASVVEPESWSRLNDDADTVRLIDPYGLIADACPYEAVFADNHTWCRGETDEYRDLWGRSERAGGSPGASNEVVFSNEEGGATIEVVPNIFSPDYDAVDDSCLIRLSAPDLTEFELRVFDRAGREVRNLKTDSYRSNEYYWDGLDNRGKRVPIGMYVVCLEISGNRASKAAVVVAR